MAASYVRFLRGTPTAFNKVADKDPDTLYFISEVDANEGDLYLGHKLIAGKDALAKINIEDLKNVVSGTSADGSILVYNEVEDKWIVREPSEVAQLIMSIMKGANSESDGEVGLVPAPKAGEQTFYLRGDGKWADPVAGLNATIKTLVADDAGLSIRQIAVASLTEALIPKDAKESLDTLQEIANWIQNHPNDASDFNNRIINLEESVFDMVDSDTGDTISIGLVTKVGNLSDEMQQLQQNMDDLTFDVRAAETNITNIYERLKWHDMV